MAKHANTITLRSWMEHLSHLQSGWRHVAGCDICEMAGTVNHRLGPAVDRDLRFHKEAFSAGTKRVRL